MHGTSSWKAPWVISNMKWGLAYGMHCHRKSYPPPRFNPLVLPSLCPEMHPPHPTQNILPPEPCTPCTTQCKNGASRMVHILVLAQPAPKLTPMRFIGARGAIYGSNVPHWKHLGPGTRGLHQLKSVFGSGHLFWRFVVQRHSLALIISYQCGEFWTQARMCAIYQSEVTQALFWHCSFAESLGAAHCRQNAIEKLSKLFLDRCCFQLILHRLYTLPIWVQCSCLLYLAHSSRITVKLIEECCQPHMQTTICI